MDKCTAACKRDQRLGICRLCKDGVVEKGGVGEGGGG